ncbi:FixH family protein [Paenibacillus spongiae]|uniref:FixH family protein n=1 Tax=Paenibacillus spongiae TaxID=2909671 RepID=A0ABY5SJA9_9BACL|nr:FixH family protein [Paenibacillus spongiae]UVI32595.1 FixH family protein [Paenibacillus spongiae]
MNALNKKIGLWIAALIAVIAIAAAIRTQAGWAAEAPPATILQTVDGLKAEMTLGTYPVKRLQSNDFTVKLSKPDGMPASSYKLHVRLSMSNMVCGVVSFELKEIAPGVYNGDAVPLMAGIWDAAVEADNGERTVMFNRKLKAGA